MEDKHWDFGPRSSERHEHEGGHQSKERQRKGEGGMEGEQPTLCVSVSLPPSHHHRMSREEQAGDGHHLVPDPEEESGGLAD